MNRILEQIDEALLEAHARSDTTELIKLYRNAADCYERDGDIDAACFYLTHAYVFALEAGDGSEGEMLRQLIAHGRER